MRRIRRKPEQPEFYACSPTRTSAQVPPEATCTDGTFCENEAGGESGVGAPQNLRPIGCNFLPACRVPLVTFAIAQQGRGREILRAQNSAGWPQTAAFTSAAAVRTRILPF